MEPLKKQFLELLDKDLEFRYAVAGYLGLSEILKRLDSLSEEQVKLREEQTKIWHEIQSLREEQIKLREEQTRIWEEIAKFREEQTKIWQEIKVLREEQARFREEQTKIWQEIAKLREDMMKGFERYDKILEKHGAEIAKLREDMTTGFELLRRHIDALGARWGLLAEESFRKGLKGIVEEYFGGTVKKWSHQDSEGYVHGHPSIIDIDLVIRDQEHILVEVKSSVSRGDISELWRIGKLYEKIKGIKPKLAIISPYIDEKAKKLAEKLKIKIYTI